MNKFNPSSLAPAYISAIVLAGAVGYYLMQSDFARHALQWIETILK
jgi:hypothetical protein